MQEKVCLIYNFGQHYRLGIFKLLNESLNIKFFFGDKLKDIKKIDYKQLNNNVEELTNIKIFKNFYYQKGASELIFKNYTSYILLGEYYCISTWFILLIGLFTKKKIFLWTHGWYGKESSAQKIIKKIFFNLADGIFLYGNYAKDLMIEEGFDSEKLHVIYNSLNYDEQMIYRKQCTSNDLYTSYFQNNYPTLIFIGRLTKIKKLNYIIEAMALLKKNNVHMNLAIIGNGEEINTLKDLVSKFQLNDNIWFVGSLYEEKEISNFVYNADLCISPGNVGLTAMHSMMYGTPVITNSDYMSQMPEFEAIKPGLTGDFFENNNVDDLSIKINNWLNLKKSRNGIRESCYNIIDSCYNPHNQLNTIINAIKTVNEKKL